MRCFVHGVDRESIDEQLEWLAESHWAYMDEMAATVLPRMPAAEYPRTNEAAAAALASGSDYTDEFEFGLDLILDGLERLRKVPAYLGPAGWLGLDLDERTDLEEAAELLEDPFRLTAPARLVATLDRRGPRATPGGWRREPSHAGRRTDVSLQREDFIEVGYHAIETWRGRIGPPGGVRDVSEPDPPARR